MSRKQRRPAINTDKVRARLERAREDQLFVRIRRWYDDADTLTGFVSAVGTRWVAIAVLDDGKAPDGWDLVRLEDVTKVRISEDPAKVEIRVLEALGWWPLPVPPLLLDRTSALLRSTTGFSELLSVHTERFNPGAIWVGAVVEVGRELLLEGLDPDARWDDEVFSFKVGDITRVTIGNRYAATLHLVAEPRPVRSPETPLPLVRHRRGRLQGP